MAPRTRTSDKRSKGRRIVRRTAAAIIVAALATGGVIAVRSLRPEDEVAVTPAPVLKTAEVASGSLAVDEQIDGSVVLSATTTVRHRIEGQLENSSATDSPAGATTPSQSATNGPATAILTESIEVQCPTTPDSTVPDTTVPAVSVPVSSDPATVSPIDPSATTTTTIDPTSTTVVPAVDPTPSSTDPVPETTAAAADCPDETSTTVPDTTVAGPSGPSGLPTGGGGGGGQLPSGGGTSSGAQESTTRVTEKVTSIIADGAQVSSGDVLYTIDGSPVVLMNGLLPAWRTLSEDVDDGADIAQLEGSLVALGYDPDAAVTIDNVWDDATTDMVEAWQAGLGQETTGEVALGTVVFLSTAATVSSVTATIGEDVGEGDSILTLAAPTQEVVIDVPTELQAVVVAGVTVDLDGTPGTVSLVRTVERDGAVVVQAVITPGAELTDRANGSTISVGISQDLSSDAGNVLLVPVEALASRLDGTYALQVDNGDGTSKWVTVSVIGVDGNTVGVRSDEITTGANVLLPV